uniref:CCHC-type domain-containing protein n=1 Tax=Mycena chlorophos TaxID=658473 RepID=A0ABQ0L6A0_MYCCL|nr:predicted protein [Mycena chlorophos]
MSTVLAPRVTVAQRDSVISIHKSLHSPQLDAAERDAFLIESARTLFRLRDCCASFTEDPALSDCLFDVRDAMKRHGFHSNGPFGKLYDHISDFAAAISISIRLNRKQALAAAAAERANAQAAAERQEHLDALEHMNKLKAWNDDDDVVSLGSEPEAEPAAGPMDPKDLAKLIFGLRVSIPKTPTSSPHPSMPELVTPSPSLADRAPGVSATSKPTRGRTGFHHSLPRLLDRRLQHAWGPRPSTPALSSHAVDAWRHQVASFPTRPVYLDDWVGSTRVSTALPANGAGFASTSRLSAPKRTRRGHRGGRRHRTKTTAVVIHGVPTSDSDDGKKACFFCSSLDHLVRRCPKLDANL